MKALAVDYDGTLYFSKEKPCIRINDIEKIREFQKQGHLFGLCTGRGYDAVYEHVSKSQIDFDFYILESGAYLLGKNKEILYEQKWDVDLVYHLCEEYLGQFDGMIIHAGDIYLEYKTHHYDRYKHIDSKEELPNDIHSVVFMFPYDKTIVELAKEIESKYPLVAAYPNVVSVDMAIKGNSKGTGIHKMKEFLKVDTMCAIGDSYNDIPAIDATDISFGIDDGAKELHKHCTHVVHSIGEAIDILMED